MAFEVNISAFGKHSIITLKNLATNGYAEIYSFGALLNQFCGPIQDGFINVIDGFSGLAEAQEKLTPFFKSAKLSPFVCRVNKATYRFGQSNYQLSKYSSHSHGIHGLLFDANYTVSNQIADENMAAVTLEYLYDNNLEGFPFKYKCEVTYKLAEGNSLTVTTRATNVDEQLMPIADGWHPYFTLGDTVDDYQVEFQTKEMLEFDDDLIPTGELNRYEEFGSLRTFGPTNFDNCFTVNFAECQPLCVIRNPNKKVQVEFHPAQSYPYLQIFTPDHRKSIAIENLSAAPDAFNNGMGLKVLSPGETAEFETTFIIRSL